MPFQIRRYFCYIFLFIIFGKLIHCQKIISIYIFSPDNDMFPFSTNKLKPSAEMAKEEIEKTNILPNYLINFIYLDSKCDPDAAYPEFLKHLYGECIDDNDNLQSLNHISNDSTINSKLTTKNGFSAIFGPVCSYTIASISLMNLHVWKVPIVTIGAFAQPFRNKKTNSKYNYITATGYHYKDPSELIVQMFKKYNWKKLILLTPHGKYDYYYDYLHCSLFSIALEAAINKYQYEGGELEMIKEKLNETAILSSIKSSFSTKFRDYSIFAICAGPTILKDIMLTAKELSLDNGKYVFINVDLFDKPKNLIRPWENGIYTNTEAARNIYRHVFTVTLKPLSGERFENFTKEIKEFALRKYNYTLNDVNNFVAAFYDSVILYAKAVKQVADQKINIKNGSAISLAIKQISFIGITGNISIDENGDRNGEYILLQMDSQTGNFLPVATYSGITKEYVDVRPVEWHNKLKTAPPDTPLCGYNNEKCRIKDNMLYFILLGIFLILVLIVCIVGNIIFRNAKFQAELKAMSWIVSSETLESLESRYRRISKKENVSFGSLTKDNRKFKKKKSKISKSQNSSREFLFENFRINKFIYDKIAYPVEDKVEDMQSYHSNLSIDSIAGVQFSNINNCKLYGRIAVYKGTIVALKQIKSDKRIETTRELLLEVKKLKDSNYHHICRFIGACLDSVDKYIIYEYCCKGSLKDILAQTQLVLDWMFKYSLIQDICRGMIYIHNNIGFHGNLKSTKCVVDSRFVLKITGFGCKILSGNDKNHVTKYEEKYYQSLLWTAPERLRSDPHLATASIKSDVYSFGIICQEIIYRKGQFYIEENENMTAQEKINRVKTVYQIPFRPTIYAIEGCTEEFVKIVTDAWSEYSCNRPDFLTIKGAMRKLNRSGDTGNILDNLLSRMEHYANNLEDLVAERTEQYLEEKRRAETLLYSMLPKSVALQLIRKQKVIAESYETVTVYFSDIVGFTSLSAESTPMEIVTLLNKLYSTFDSILEQFDVYKVETIGDAYVVCSGLPSPNGNNHAREIGRMSIAFLNELFTFVIPHRQDQQLKLRIGIHSGPVCAGVVGLKMPRYCLFGDTVNTSSRMESSGLPLRIHISSSTKNILCTFNSFIMTERGYVEMKGKGLQLTYWLHGENNNIVDPIDPGDVVISNFHLPS